jgi:hypothetical protein
MPEITRTSPIEKSIRNSRFRGENRVNSYCEGKSFVHGQRIEGKGLVSIIEANELSERRITEMIGSEVKAG